MMKLDHVQLAVPHGCEDKYRPFWSDLLGFSELEKPEALRPRGGVWFSSGAVEIHLGVKPDFRPPKKPTPHVEPRISIRLPKSLPPQITMSDGTATSLVAAASSPMTLLETSLNSLPANEPLHTPHCTLVRPVDDHPGHPNGSN